ncbi:MAG: hypothetical protein AAF423_11465 [Pseudomonadota bacterium]
MKRQVIHTATDLVEATYRPELNAVYVKWFSEYDEGTRVRDAVYAALDFVRANEIQHWVVDVTTSPDGLSDDDYDWVSGDDFQSAIENSPLRKFVLLPPLPESGQDDAWVADWEANTLAKFGNGIRAKVCNTIEEVKAFLAT